MGRAARRALITLASWVGYDTDGRTDIGWWDTLRLRLTMKHLQLVRVHGQVAGLPGGRRPGRAPGAGRDRDGPMPRSLPVRPVRTRRHRNLRRLP